MNLVKHKEKQYSCVVEEFEAKNLGAPFKVFLDNSVSVVTDEKTGEVVSYTIPDLPGLLQIVVMTRLLHPRKFTGADIKFVRKYLGFKQKDLASKIELSVEHLSRCETGVFPVSPASEKLFRIFSFKSALKIHKIKTCKEKTDLENALDKLFDGLKPHPVYDSEQELVFRFHRCHVTESDGADDDHWDGEEDLAA